MEYTWPYASGEKQRADWTNSKVRLDKERAAAGLAKYQPGALFNPRDAFPLFEWAGYYNPSWYSLFGRNVPEENYLFTWTGMLNSPLIRRSSKITLLFSAELGKSKNPGGIVFRPGYSLINI